MNTSKVEQVNYYDSRWPKEHSGPNSIELLRLAKILEYAAMTGLNFRERVPKICDLGCGRGWLSMHLSSLGSVVGVDFSIEAIKQASERIRSVEFMHGDILSHRSSEKFDLVVSSEVIEHIEDKRGFLETVTKLLRPGGHLILTTPNRKLYKHFLQSEWEKQPLELWLYPNELRSLLLETRKFRIMRHTTFANDILGTHPKIQRAFRAVRLERLRVFIDDLLFRGLHQIVHATYIGHQVSNIDE